MNKFLKFAMVGAACLSIAACSRVPAGNVGVKVYMLGSEKGVDSEVLTPGRYWIGINEELFIFPTFTQNKTWEGAEGKLAFSFQTVEGMVVGADLGMSYSIQPDKVSTIFEKYRRGVDEITDIYLKNMIRDALVTEASKIRVESVYGNGKEELMKAVEERVRKQVAPIGITVERLYWIGQLDLPREVIEKINAKVNADQITQQKQAELEQAKAEAAKTIASAEGDKQAEILRAEGVAEGNRIINETLNENLIKYKQIEKWNGVTPKVTGGATPLVNIGD